MSMPSTPSPAPKRGAPENGSDIALLHRWQLRFFVVVTSVGALILLGILFWLLSHIGDALLLFLFSMLIAYVLYPLVRLLQRFLSRPLAILITYIGIFVILMAFLYLVGLTALNQLVSLIGHLQQSLPNLLNRLQQFFNAQHITNISAEQLQSFSQQALNYALNVISNVQPFVFGIFGAFINTILVITLSVYFVIYGPRFKRWLGTETPNSQRRMVVFFIQTLDRTVGGFVRGQLILGAIMGFTVGVGLFLLGVPYAMLLAAIIFIFEFIPQIGSYISGAIVVLTALATRGWEIGLIVLVFCSFMQGIVDGQILAPRIIGHSVGLNPIISIFALLVGTSLFGLLGAFFSAPLAGVIQSFIVVGYRAWKQEHPEEFAPQSTEERQQPANSFERAIDDTENAPNPDGDLL